MKEGVLNSGLVRDHHGELFLANDTDIFSLPNIGMELFMTLVSAQMAAKRAERLLEIFGEIGAAPVPFKGVMGGALSLWEIIRNLATPGDLSDSKVVERYVTGAGIHDLAAKITAVWDKCVKARRQLEPHLTLLAQTHYVGQNTENARWVVIDGEARDQQSADKVIELYWACLCLLAKMSVELDHPYESSRGTNPDVIATAPNGSVWAFALKTLSRVAPENTAKNLANLIYGAAEQILCARCDKGVVVVNMKNVLNHEDLRLREFANWQSARDALEAQVDAIRERFWESEAERLLPIFEKRSAVAPIAILVAHATVLCYPEGSSELTVTEVKAMKITTLPHRYDPATEPFAAEVVSLARVLNDIVQLEI